MLTQLQNQPKQHSFYVYLQAQTSHDGRLLRKINHAHGLRGLALKAKPL